MFSFNNPFGACGTCEGFGRVAGIEEDLVIPDPQKSIRAGAIAPFSTPKFGSYLRDFIKVAAQEKIPIDIPYSELDKEAKRIIWKGQGEYSGIDGFRSEEHTSELQSRGH